MHYYLLSHFEINRCYFEVSYDGCVIAKHPYVEYFVVFNLTKEWPRLDKVV